MSLAIVNSRARVGIDAPAVTVEVHLANGLPSFSIVGLPEASVKEAKDRVRSALINAHFEFPAKRITVNLAPADLPKEGGRFDLPIAIGILAASGQIPLSVLADYEFYGELALSGAVRPIIGEIPTTMAATQANRTCVLPAENAQRAALVSKANILAVDHIHPLFAHLSGQQALPFFETDCTPKNLLDSTSFTHTDLQDVIGQPMAKRALEIAAAGQHNLLFIGPPGTGKSMLAQRLTSIMPEMSETEALQSAAIHSVCGQDTNFDNWKQRPFRSPHHTCSAVALVGGSSNPKPGEISLAHNGVLFLDELPEFDRKVLDVLREPMETGSVTISRAARQADFPAQFQLIAAMNPSPTGHHDDGRASPDQVLRYLNKLSGPFLDRIDLQLDVPRLPKGALTQAPERGETSAVVKQRVKQARELQLNRAGKVNALMTNRDLDCYCKLQPSDAQFLEMALEKLNLSARAYHKILKVARTIADLQGEIHINRQHLSEALGYRAMDRLLNSLKAA
ncbi:YifB family Mg chelatase-like AAA ATPase [Flocculibacter collagenilyticus]|uniref:YifB family Mg chelatase-like AAA ATPase n=1 Tax=Flocculibacter collagenilyticus TaxID=2744479 RepID=UPI0018F4FC02|nr:YifB family Mg chelatase-like AAA ATPase [Flocculibacter collagenilyticus]